MAAVVLLLAAVIVWRVVSRGGASASAEPRAAATSAPKTKSLLAIAAAATPPARLAAPAAPASSEPAPSDSRANLAVFAGDGLSPDFIAAFNLDPREVALLTAATQQAKSQLQDIAARAAQATTDRGGRIVINLPSLADQGGDVYDQLLATFNTTLGPERARQFSATAGKAFDAAFDEFGAAEAHYELMPEPAADGSVAYHVKKTFTLPDVSGTVESTETSTNIGEKYPLIVKILANRLSPEPTGPH